MVGWKIRLDSLHVWVQGLGATLAIRGTRPTPGIRETGTRGPLSSQRWCRPETFAGIDYYVWDCGCGETIKRRASRLGKVLVQKSGKVVLD